MVDAAGLSPLTDGSARLIARPQAAATALGHAGASANRLLQGRRYEDISAQ